MTDTTISDGLVFFQDDGTGVPDGSEDFTSAAIFQLLSKHKGDSSYVGEDQSGDATLQFNDIDTTNNQVDVGTGYAYIMDGGHTVQSGAQDVYDTTLPVNSPYVVILPSEVTNLGLDSGTNDVWLALDPTQNDSVFIRHGSGLSAPSEPSVKLGTVDASSGATTRANDLASSTHKSLDTDDQTINQSVTYPDGTTVTTSPGDLIDDGNSPQTDTGVTSSTFTLADTFDVIQVFLGVEDVSGTGNEIDLRVNGDTNGNYNFTDISGTRTTGATEIENIFSLGGDWYQATTLFMSGRFSGSWGGSNNPVRSLGRAAHVFDNTAVTSPIDSLTIIADGAFDVEWEVKGIDVNGAGEP